MKLSIRKNTIIIGFFLSSVTAGFAQMGNFWTQQVGTEGLLMGGALVAAQSNNAGLYYNPASISSNTISSFSFNSALFRTQFIWANNNFGEGTDFYEPYSYFESPFISMMIPLKNKLGVKIGAGVFSRQNVDYNILSRVYRENPFPELNHADADYEGIFNYRIRSSEHWLVFSSSRKFSDKLSLGFSAIVAIRTFDYSNLTKADYYYSEGSAGERINAEFSFENKAYLLVYKLIIKGGIVYNINENNRIGLAVSTPSMRIFSSAKNYRAIRQSNIDKLVDPDEADNYPDKVISNFSDELKGDFKNPLSISAGYEHNFGEDVLSFSVQYYNGIKKYNMIKPGEMTDENLINKGFPEMEGDYLKQLFGLKPIFNFAVGFKKNIRDKYLVMGGFRTNFSATKNVNYTREEQWFATFDLNISQYYLSGGFTFIIKNNHIIIGLDLGFGSTKNENYIVNFSQPSIVNSNNIPLVGDLYPNMSKTLFTTGIMLGYRLKF